MLKISILKSFVQKKIDLGIILFLSIISIALVAIILWGLNKGFDFSDEGFYVLGYQENQEHFIVSTHFHLIVKFFFGYIPLNPINIRILSLLTSIISSLIFTFFTLRSYTLITNIKINRLGLIIAYIFTINASFASYIFPLRGFSYNTITTSLLLISFSIMFYVCSKILITQKKSLRNNLLIILSGYFLGFLLFVKITSFAATVGILFIGLMFICMHKKYIKLILPIAAFFILGIFLSLITFFTFIQSFSDFIFYLNELKQVLTNNVSASDGHNLSSYGSDVLTTTLRIIVFIFIGISFTFSYRFLKKDKKIKSFILLLFFILSICTDYLFSNLFFGVNTYKYADTLLLLTTISFVFFITNILLNGFKINKKILFLSSFIFIAPMISAFGSNNGLLVNAVFTIPFWAILIVFFAYKGNKYVHFTIASIFSLLLFYHVLLKYVVQPYRIQPLIFQTETISHKIKRAKGLLVDLQTKKQIEYIHKILKANNFKTADPIIGLYRIPGLIYLLEGVSPGGILWNPEQINLFLKNLEYSKDDIRKSFIITSAKIDLETQEKLKKFYISLNKSHIIIGTCDNYTIYKPILIGLDH